MPESVYLSDESVEAVERDDVYVAPFKAGLPISNEDGRRGRTCVLTGMWAPASQIVETDYGPMVARYATMPREDY